MPMFLLPFFWDNICICTYRIDFRQQQEIDMFDYDGCCWCYFLKPLVNVFLAWLWLSLRCLVVSVIIIMSSNYVKYHSTHNLLFLTRIIHKLCGKHVVITSFFSPSCLYHSLLFSIPYNNEQSGSFKKGHWWLMGLQRRTVKLGSWAAWHQNTWKPKGFGSFRGSNKHPGTLHSLKLTARTWKWMVGRWSFPFGS